MTDSAHRDVEALRATLLAFSEHAIARNPGGETYRKREDALDALARLEQVEQERDALCEEMKLLERSRDGAQAEAWKVAEARVQELEAALSDERASRRGVLRKALDWRAQAEVAESALEAAEAELARVREKAKTAKSIAAAPDYDEEAVKFALWAVVDAALAAPDTAEGR